MSNEAAERLLLGPYSAWDRESWEGTEGVEAALCTAVAYVKISLGYVLAAERKATVERIRAGVYESIEAHGCSPCGTHEYAFALLDAEATR